MDLFFAMTVDGVEPEISRPEAADLIAGSPELTCWDLENAAGGISAGRWQATQGKWRFENPYWEYVRVISGVSIVTGEDGVAHRIGAGDSLVLRDGFKGTWEVIETTLKDYVIRE